MSGGLLGASGILSMANSTAGLRIRVSECTLPPIHCVLRIMNLVNSIYYLEWPSGPLFRDGSGPRVQEDFNVPTTYCMQQIAVYPLGIP